MLGRLLGLVFVLMLGWFIYSQLFGTDAERAKGQALAGKAKDLGKEIVGIFQHEANREKTSGTYSTALNKLGDALKNLTAADSKSEFKTKIAELEAKRKALEEQMKQAQSLKNTGAKAAGDLSDKEAEIKALAEEVQKLAEQMEKK
jgi:DNA repair exonuclease SbcCD ATPase subunit